MSHIGQRTQEILKIEEYDHLVCGRLVAIITTVIDGN